jgi:hypothetical protein
MLIIRFKQITKAAEKIKKILELLKVLPDPGMISEVRL